MGLEGWTIILRDRAGDEIERTTTYENGRYCFGDLPSGTYTVEEVGQPGWEQVFPGGSEIHEITLPATLNLIENGDFEAGNTGFGSDYDLVTTEGHDGGNDNLGTLDKPEAYAIGTNPYLYHELWSSFGDHTSGTGKMMIVNGSTGTDVSVWFTSTDIIPGTDYTFSFWSRSSYSKAIAEVDVWINGVYQNTFTGPTESWAEHSLDWNSGTSNSAKIEFICNTSVYDGTDFALDDISLIGQPSYNFVNEEKVFDIAGYKLNADVDEGLGGWTINLEKWDETLDVPDWIPFDTRTTDSNGKYCFKGLEAGTYKVSEVLISGWEQDYPENNEHIVVLPEDASDCEEETNLYNFVNAELFDLCGHKYGVDWLGIETPLAGWTIKLMDGDKVTATTTTDADGHYCFKDLRAGDYTIVESFGEMNIDGFWVFNSKFYRPEESAEIEVSLPNDASDCEDPVTHHNFYNLCHSGETAWMFGNKGFIKDLNLGSANWGWSFEVGILKGTEARTIFTQPIYAGAAQEDITKGYLVGWVDVSWDGAALKADIVPVEGMTLVNTKIWIGNTALPLAKKGVMTNAPGMLITSPTLDYSKITYIAIHFKAYVPCMYEHPVIEASLQ